jgi:tRNA A-37 threonylcarbamoyl transferase component Bud32
VTGYDDRMDDDTGVLFDGRYALDGILGAGGTGTVHRAWDRVLDRPVALKMLRSGASDDSVHRIRLRAEAQLAGSLHHPGIAQIYDYGEAPAARGDGPLIPYIAMRLVDGEPLDSVLKERRRLPADEVMTIVAQVAEALQVAHEAGIVHRDLKPGNILITPDGRPVLVDFGIARSDGLEPLTLTGTIVGSVDYMSPEQTMGSSATPRSDVYSLGMVAYEALSGQRPFRRESQVATALAHLHDDLPPLPDDVPPAVGALVLEMTSREPDDRPPSAGEVSARAAALGLDPWDPGAVTTVIARRRTDTESARRPGPSASWPRSRRTLIGAAVLVAVVVSSVFVAARPAVNQVPDLRGMKFGAAARALHERGLDEVGTTYVDDPGTERGIVLAQDPSPGAGAEDGDVVTLRLASGSVRLRSGGLVGEGYVEAARRVVELGLVPRRGQVTRTAGAGTVVDVGPAGRLRLGSLVTLTVAVAPEPAPEPAPIPAVAVAAPVAAPPPSTSSPRQANVGSPARPSTRKAPKAHAPKAHGKSGKAHGKKHGKRK